jgi:hypothetical protein
LFPKVITFEKPKLWFKAQSVIATAIAPLCEIIEIFHLFISLLQKLKFKFLKVSAYQRQFGQRIIISFSLAIFFILSSSS